ncbi:unnamed protein product [Umbelopsis ramanniana]
MILGQHLASVCDGRLLPSHRPNPPPSLPSPPHTTDIPFLTDDIEEAIRRLPIRKPPGSDHLRAEMLKPIVKLTNYPTTKLERFLPILLFADLHVHPNTTFPPETPPGSSCTAAHLNTGQSSTSPLPHLFTLLASYMLRNLSVVRLGYLEDEGVPT